MAFYAGQLGGETNVKASRIDGDVNIVKEMTGRLDLIEARITRNARQLGYFTEQPSTGASAPTPVITTLADALRELDRAIDRAFGALNLFD